MANDGIQNLSKLIQKLKIMQSDLIDELEKTMDKETLRVQGDARLLCPVKSGDLRRRIKTDVTTDKDVIIGTVYNNLEYAAYVEFGTGPKGEENHEGISPDVVPSYRQSGWTYYDTEEDKFIHTKGQPAQPFMYPALKNNEKTIENSIKNTVKKVIGKATTK